jgi:hypothetical protein
MLVHGLHAVIVASLFDVLLDLIEFIVPDAPDPPSRKIKNDRTLGYSSSSRRDLNPAGCSQGLSLAYHFPYRSQVWSSFNVQRAGLTIRRAGIYFIVPIGKFPPDSKGRKRIRSESFNIEGGDMVFSV